MSEIVINSDIYQVGGSLKNHAPSYVVRSADFQLYNALKKGEYCYVFNCRQMGKTSLLVQMRHRFTQEGYQCTSVDLTRLGSEKVSLEQWHKGLIVDLWRGFNLLDKFNLKSWLQEINGLSNIQILILFFEKILKHFSNQKILIFFDEIDTLIGLNELNNELFPFIRSCYNQRALNPEYERLTFAFFGVTTPADLIQDPQITPFNIGQSIDLYGIKINDAQPLVQGLANLVSEPEIVMPEIFAWTGGQPFLTQKLCRLVVNSLESENSAADLVRKDRDWSSWVDKLVRSQIIQNWESQDDPEHIRTIRNRLVSNPQRLPRLLGIYQQILQGSQIKCDDSREHLELKLSGLVVNFYGYLTIKNKIYQEIFNLAWVENKLSEIRPYAQDFDAWIASGQQNNYCLLRGEVLQDALAWTLGKSLSDLDYQFLSASQALSKREVEKNLAVVELASQILSDARHEAKQENFDLKKQRLWRLAIAFFMSLGIVLLRMTGLFQTIEWGIYDQYFRLRPVEPIDPRIAIVTIDDTDVNQVGQWPFPDRVLLQVLENLKQQNPSQIGLDLYRNLPVEPGYDQLSQLFRSTPNLIGVEKRVKPQVLPPPILQDRGQVAMIDLVTDADGKIRRGLLSVKSAEDDSIHLSLGSKLAINYLEQHGVTLEKIDGNQLQLGQARIVPFHQNDGSYVRANDGGYQVLLNFRGSLDNFRWLSFSDVLANQIKPTGEMSDSTTQPLADCIVLIGAIAESLNDLHHTPYSSSWSQSLPLTPGVVIHANLVSQIISAALDGRPMMKVWSEMQEWLWILLWSAIGAGLSYRFHSKVLTVGLVVLAGFSLMMFTYQAFIQGWWVPVLPPVLGLFGSAIAVTIMCNQYLEELQLRRIFDWLLRERLTHPTAASIAIQYLKQSESNKNQALLDRWLREIKAD